MMTDTHPMIIDNTDELLTYLDPAKWKDDWYFRGVHCEPQGKSRALLSSAWRGGEGRALFESFLRKRTGVNTLETLSQLEPLKNLGVEESRLIELIQQVYFENYMLASFYEHANRIGLRIPADILREIDNYSPSYWLDAPLTLSEHVLSADHYNKYTEDPRFCPGDGINYSKDLPQHYGVPTRLLDFTSDPRKALFFSFHCNNNECCCNSGNEYSSIYALNPAYSSHAPINTHITHDRDQNKFLHAQDGVFVNIGHANMYFIQHGKWPTLQEASPSAVQEIKYPNSLKKEIYKKLRRCQVSISNLMPSYHSAAEEIKLDLNHLP